MTDEMESLVIDLVSNLNNVFVSVDDCLKVTLNIREMDGDEYFTALLLALSVHHSTLTGSSDNDLLEFTYLLNRLAVDYLMESKNLKKDVE